MSQPRLIALVPVLGTLPVYMPATHHEFVNYDDGGYVIENPTVKAGLIWHGIKYALATQLAGSVENI
jgi:hypothetical protein